MTWAVWAVSVVLNAAIGGRLLEPLCARAWRCGWVWAVVFFDRAAAWFEDDHCEASSRRADAMRARWGFRAAPDGRE
jgi:hypothetical protein